MHRVLYSFILVSLIADCDHLSRAPADEKTLRFFFAPADAGYTCPDRCPLRKKVVCCWLLVGCGLLVVSCWLFFVVSLFLCWFWCFFVCFGLLCFVWFVFGLCCLVRVVTIHEKRECWLIAKMPFRVSHLTLVSAVQCRADVCEVSSFAGVWFSLFSVCLWCFVSLSQRSQIRLRYMLIAE